MASIYYALQSALFADSCAAVDSASGMCPDLEYPPGLSVAAVGDVPMPLPACISEQLALLARSRACRAEQATEAVSRMAAGSFAFTSPSWHVGLASLLILDPNMLFATRRRGPGATLHVAAASE